MYQDHINTPDQALVHLAFHCSLKDGDLQAEELDLISANFVAKGLNKDLDLKEEMKSYQSYYRTIRDETAFLIYLLRAIKPSNKLAMFAFCAEIITRDGKISLSEEVLMNKIASLLYIKDHENSTVQRLILELNDVERNNAF